MMLPATAVDWVTVRVYQLVFVIFSDREFTPPPNISNYFQERLVKNMQGKITLGDGLQFKNADTKNKKGWLSKEDIQSAVK